MTSFDAKTDTDGLIEKLVGVRRVAKVVKGGRIFGFSSLVVVGDGNGRIGCGRGKAKEVPVAIQKAMEDGRKSMQKVLLKNGTLQHPLIGRHGATKVIMLPASEGTGLIAGGAMRAVCEVMGIKDVLAKCVGSRNPVNVVLATINGLTEMKTVQSVAEKRGLDVKDILEEQQNEEEQQ
ncbi:MAG: 30S ribosomal protein S5 [Gammaproteobacteria bacterium]|nr:30S ribosomal protein S5 [Gammaproteobacteria bacterium]